MSRGMPVMQAETVGALIQQVRAIEEQIRALRRTVDAEALAVSDRQYLSRCFDLLDMELGALGQYIDALR
ncbi:MAG TPA: hypothetical protein VGF48_14690 [Thermoanaerobaculia bacterium]